MLLRILALAFSLLAGGCANISQSTVDLSNQVETQMGEMQRLHINAINLHFDTQRQKIEHFLTKTWEPLFLINFLDETKILAELQQVDSKSAEPALMMIEFAQDAHDMMRQKRQEWLQPLEQMRTKTLQDVSIAYADVLAAQSAITARLQAASRATQEQDRLVDALTHKEGTAQKLRAGMECAGKKMNAALTDLGTLPEIKLEAGKDLKSLDLKSIEANLKKVDDTLGFLANLANLGDCNGTIR